MSFLIPILSAIFGLIIGSFLNVVIYRLEHGESVAKGRSYCPHCKHQLAWIDLVPVASFLWLRGACRYCGKKISWQYPVVETVTALMFLLILNFKFEILNQFSIFNVINILVLWFVAASLVVIFAYDLRHYLIPDVVLFPAIGVMAAWDLGAHWSSGFLNFLLAAAIAAGFFLAIFLVSKGKWIGFGDVKLAVLLGLLLGFPNILVGLWLSFFLGAVVGIIAMVAKKKGMKSEMPFAPFLILGTFLALFWGQQLLQWYNHFIS